MTGPPIRSEVFGTSALRRHSYVDRGALDAELRDLIRAERHIVIHGDSKQGKTWLRAAVLSDSDVVTLQCQPQNTVATLLQQALGVLGIRSTLRFSRENSLSGEIDLSASGEVGVKLLARAKATGRIKGAAATKGVTDSAPIGRTPGDLAWVAFMLQESNRRLVLEDFHYLPAAVQRDFSFLLKALLEYGVFVIIIGVWAEDHLLSYYNGDLAGRVEDVRLEWAAEELDDVLDRGSRALNINLTPEIRRDLVADSFGNVGLLQRGAEQLCREAGVRRRSHRREEVSDLRLLRQARGNLASSMAGRFLTFADRVSGHRAIYRDVLRAVVQASDDDLLTGLSISSLPGAIISAGGRPRTKSELRAKLLVISDVQASVEIQPPVLAWDQPRNRLFLVDRSFLHFRKYGAPTWPWEV